jgi:homoprotocatechuate degradation regulator HpaR
MTVTDMTQPEPARNTARITHRDLPQLLLQGREQLMTHFRRVLKRFGLTEQQWRILRALDTHRALEPRELCALCQIHSASMVGMLARMEALGLLQRSRMAGDQRRVLVELSSGGDALIDHMAPLVEQQYHQLEAAFGRQVFDDLQAALSAFLAAEAACTVPVALPMAAPSQVKRSRVAGRGVPKA